VLNVKAEKESSEANEMPLEDFTIYQSSGNSHMNKKVLAKMLVALGIIVLIAAGCYAIFNPKTVGPNK
jgi:hypothetical protein